MSLGYDEETFAGFEYSSNGWRVSAHHLDSSLGDGVFRAHNAQGDCVGELTVSGNLIEDIEINISYRRRGAASALLEIARYKLGRVDHNWDDMTNAGQAWAEAVD